MAKQKMEYVVPEYVEKFLKYQKHIKKKDTSDNTITAYCSDIYHFIEWLKQYKNTNEVTLNILDILTLDDLHSWIYSLKVSASSESRKVSAIHSLFKYLNDMKLINNTVAKDLKKPELPKDNTIKYLPIDKAKELKETAKIEGTERDLAIITLLLNSGMRVSELIKLNLDDVDGNVITVRKSKGNKSREIVINDETLEILKNYLLVRPQTSDKALFVLNYFIDKEPYRITRASIAETLKKYADMIGVKHLTPHTLRHTFGTSKRMAGVSLDTLKELMGHEHIETLLIYAKPTREEKIRVADMGSI